MMNQVNDVNERVSDIKWTLLGNEGYITIHACTEVLKIVNWYNVNIGIYGSFAFILLLYLLQIYIWGFSWLNVLYICIIPTNFSSIVGFFLFWDVTGEVNPLQFLKHLCFFVDIIKCSTAKP